MIKKNFYFLITAFLKSIQLDGNPKFKSKILILLLITVYELFKMLTAFIQAKVWF